MLHHVRPWQPRGFAPNRLLEITPEFLDAALRTVRAAGFELVSLTEAVERLREGRAGKPFAVITFDDGYRDNVDHALPILRRHGAPWTLFVTTGFAERTAALWWLELEEAVARLPEIDFIVGPRHIIAKTRSDWEKSAAFQRIYWALRDLSEPDLRQAMSDICARAGIDRAGLVADLCLDWTGIRQLAAEPDIEIGAHTLTHPRLARQDAVFARHEIVDCRAVTARQIGREVNHFAYPVGDPGSAGLREFQMAAEAGYASAVTTRPGHVFPEHAAHLHALPRVSLNGHFQTESAVRALISGVPFLLWNRGRRLNVG
jgi:peptidoglycan/xylan/chitin deacetylase (PgdA/CDA1 family)